MCFSVVSMYFMIVISKLNNNSFKDKIYTRYEYFFKTFYLYNRILKSYSILMKYKTQILNNILWDNSTYQAK